MDSNRMEAFSDGVIAIIITIMVLEMKPPHSAEWNALKPVLPVFLSYILSFTYLGIYWNNHHHLLKAVDKVNGRVLWANLTLLFWLSLIPFTSAWMGENHFQQKPVILYGANLLAAGLSYRVLTLALLKKHGTDSILAKALGPDIKGKISVALYAVAIILSFLHPLAACVIYAAVAVIWIIPDRRIEKVLGAD